MSEFVTVARPYAKAAFDFAVEHNSVERWQDMLAFAAEVTKNDQIRQSSLRRFGAGNALRSVYRYLRRATRRKWPEPD